MPAYYKNNVAELRQICETRGIEHDGLAKTRLIAALREADEQQELASQVKSMLLTDAGSSEPLCPYR